jgi:hypothetical protein
MTRASSRTLEEMPLSDDQTIFFNTAGSWELMATWPLCRRFVASCKSRATLSGWPGLRAWSGVIA